MKVKKVKAQKTTNKVVKIVLSRRSKQFIFFGNIIF